MPRQSPFPIDLGAEEKACWKRWLGDIRHRIVMSSGPRSCSTPPRACATTRSPRLDTPRQIVSKWRKRFFEQRLAGLEELPRRGGRASFPPSIVVAVKALACELPSELDLPLSRFSMPEIQREAIRRGLVASIGETTVWRWLSEDAIRPWHHRSWIFPRDPDFADKAGRVLDLYEGVWEGPAAGAERLRHLRRREDQHPGPPPHAPHLPPRTRPPDARRARVRAQRRLGLSGRVGRAPGPSLRPLRSARPASLPSNASFAR